MVYRLMGVGWMCRAGRGGVVLLDLCGGGYVWMEARREVIMEG